MSQDQNPSGTGTPESVAATETTAGVAGTTETPDATPETGGEYLSETTAAQQKVAEGLRTVGEKVESLAPGDGVAKDIADKASAGLKHASEWVEGKDAGAMLTEAKSFVRRKPWAAAAIGVGALLVVSKLFGGSKRGKH